MTRDGLEAPISCYKSIMENYQHEYEKDLPKEVDLIDVPVLYIRGKNGAIARPETMYAAVQAGLLPHLEQMKYLIRRIGCHMRNQEVVMRIEKWLGKHLE